MILFLLKLLITFFVILCLYWGAIELLWEEDRVSDEWHDFVQENCIFADTCWENGKWKNYCQLGADGVSDCDLENGECSKLKTLSGVSLT